MPTRDQVLALAEQGCDYREIGRRLGIPAGQAYLIGTGMPADGGDAHTGQERARPGVLPTAQSLLGARAEDPTTNQTVLAWMRARARDDAQMREAGSRRGES